jgi:protein-disulfide isomerase
VRSKGFWAVACAAAQALFVGGCGGSSTSPAAPSAESVFLAGPADETAQTSDLGAAGMRLAPNFAPSTGASQAAEWPAIRVEASKVPVPRSDARTRGPATAPVTIQVFSDFECPYCAHAAPIVRELEHEFGARVRIVWHDFPLPGHAHARAAAATGIEVYLQHGGAAFWRFHDAIFQAQAHGLDAKVIETLAVEQGVDVVRLRGVLANGTHDARIDADIRTGDAIGVNGTPAFLVNDWLAIGLLPYAEFRAIVRHTLSERR